MLGNGRVVLYNYVSSECVCVHLHTHYCIQIPITLLFAFLAGTEDGYSKFTPGRYWSGTLGRGDPTVQSVAPRLSSPPLLAFPTPWVFLPSLLLPTPFLTNKRRQCVGSTVT